MSDVLNGVAIFLVCVAAFFLMLLPFAAPLLLLSYAGCMSQLRLGGLEGTWGPLVECQVKTSDGHYIPYDRWRGMENLELKRAK